MHRKYPMRKLVVTLMFLFPLFLFCQNAFEISGEVDNFKNEAISIGDILLFSLEKDSLIKYTTILNGKFSLSSIPDGNYRLKVSALGFESQEIMIELVKDIELQLKLRDDITELDEVEIIAAKPIVANENGNLKFDIQNPVFSSIPDPLDVLARLPGIQLSPDRESLTVMDKGVPLIYMGNQRISMQELKALSVDGIDSIAIVSQSIGQI